MRLIGLKLLIFNFNIDIARVALEGVVYIHLRRALVAITAKRHVHVLTADHGLHVLTGCAEREARILLAQLANRSQFFNLLTLRNEVENVREGASQECAL